MANKSVNLKLDKILWIDLEMTGLSDKKDLILEIAAIVTDWNFKELDTYEGIIKNNSFQLKRRLKANADFWDNNAENRKIFLEQNKQGKPIKEIENELINFIKKNFDIKKPILLGGNSIHADRRFIVKKWPKLDKMLFYRMLDVSAWKVVFEYKYNKQFAKPNNHRAIDDIRGSISELQYYLNHLKS